MKPARKRAEKAWGLKPDTIVDRAAKRVVRWGLIAFGIGIIAVTTAVNAATDRLGRRGG